MASEQLVRSLVDFALASGAARADVILAGDIVVNPGLAEKCRDPICPGYGQSANCPPHVAGPSGMANRLKQFHRAVVFSLEVSGKDLFSDRRPAVFRRLHEISAGLERAAVDAGFSRARGYAGGSCRELFCPEYPDCPALDEDGYCRFPEYARPSISGFGIDVAALFDTVGWALRLAAPGETDMADLCGLVLVD